MSSNNSGSVEWIPEVRCWCGEVAPVRMSWSYANPGKRFRACPRYRGNGNCRYFEWLDSDVSERVAKVIRGLLKRLDKQETEMQRFQANQFCWSGQSLKNSSGYDSLANSQHLALQHQTALEHQLALQHHSALQPQLALQHQTALQSQLALQSALQPV
nr:uncharacterized protein LOC109168447 [Ipomoea trifida]